MQAVIRFSTFRVNYVAIIVIFYAICYGISKLQGKYSDKKLRLASSSLQAWQHFLSLEKSSGQAIRTNSPTLAGPVPKSLPLF